MRQFIMSRFIIKAFVNIIALVLICRAIVDEILIPAENHRIAINRTKETGCSVYSVIAHALGYSEFFDPMTKVAIHWGGGRELSECDKAQIDFYHKLYGKQCHMPMNVIFVRLKLQAEKEGTWPFNEECQPWIPG